MKLKTPYPKKRLGQHFLKDGNIIRKIIARADIIPGEPVLEIGPGTGELTAGLLAAGAVVTAIEADAGLSGFLAERFNDEIAEERLRIITADALKVSFLELANGRAWRCVSNLPYNVSGPVITKLINERLAFTSMTLMLQKEVAQRLVASPGGKAYGILSILSQMHAGIEIAFDVGPSAFFPAPKVTSSVVALTPLPAPRANIPDEGFFRKTVTASFTGRRKTLANSLRPLGIPQEAVKDAIARCGIAGVRRGETLTIAEWAALSAELRAAAGKDAGQPPGVQPG
ncbi:MAG: ribosomal RNA small subunit methyltransferase A [Deltaproteobacteria bacterium]|nr:ribosomal RNA small subunit methyltransferase A [Deltaproteobacteria bacterium]